MRLANIFCSTGVLLLVFLGTEIDTIFSNNFPPACSIDFAFFGALSGASTQAVPILLNKLSNLIVFNIDPNQNRWSQPPISQNIPPTMRPKSVHEEGLSRNSASRGGPDSFSPPLQGGRKSYDAAAQQVHEAEVNYGRNMNETQMSATMNPYNSLGRQRYKNAVPKDDFRNPYSQDDHNRYALLILKF